MCEHNQNLTPETCSICIANRASRNRAEIKDVFEEVKVEEVLKAFPDVVNPAKDENWKFVESWEDNIPGLVVTVSRFGDEEKVMMKGVCPNGHGALKELAKKLKFELPLEFGK